jgi:hypothetical protein
MDELLVAAKNELGTLNAKCFCIRYWESKSSEILIAYFSCFVEVKFYMCIILTSFRSFPQMLSKHIGMSHYVLNNMYCICLYVDVYRGVDKIMETKKFRKKICIGYSEKTSVGNTECSSICLYSVVLVPVHSDCVELQSA